MILEIRVNKMKVIDLFSGVGGLSAGFEKAGYDIVLANEFDKDIAKSYQLNHKKTIMINDDIKNILPEVEKYKNKIDVIIGGPPCQGFSMAGARIRKNSFLEDPRNFLFRNYFSVVQAVEPKYFVMENVPGMLSMENGKIIEEIEKIFSDEKNFKKGRYYLYRRVFSTDEYGVPQSRSRLIIFGSKNKLDFEKLFEDTKKQMIEDGRIKKVTIEDAISDLNWLESSEGNFEQEYKIEPKSEYQKERRKNAGKLYNHIATNHNEKALERIKQLSQGGRRLDLKDGEKIKSVHSGAYGRMRWDEVAKTLITRFDTPSSGVYIHPERNRTLTPREAARIQSFDDDFIFYGNKSSIIKQIGNAVPPLFAYYLANVIKNAENGGYNNG
jgi:DNA (cytosine-5)-methyltransferase 1